MNSPELSIMFLPTGSSNFRVSVVHIRNLNIYNFSVCYKKFMFAAE